MPKLGFDLPLDVVDSGRQFRPVPVHVEFTRRDEPHRERPWRLWLLNAQQVVATPLKLPLDAFRWREGRAHCPYFGKHRIDFVEKWLVHVLTF